jgi:hypothetical protein
LAAGIIICCFFTNIFLPAAKTFGWENAKFETPKRPFGCFLRVPHFHNTPTELFENEMNLSEEVGAGTK